MKSIIFISHTAQLQRPFLDPSTRYRAYNIAAALSKLGYRTAVVSQKAFEEGIEEYSQFDYFVFHRPLMSEKIADFLVANRFSDRIIADFDDFIFDVHFAHLMPSHRFRAQPLEQTSNYLAMNAAASRCFSRFSLSTAPLRDEVVRLFGAPNAEIIHNALDPGYQGAAKLIRQRMVSIDRAYRFGYFSGTATHDADFEHISEAIAQAMDDDLDARMLVLGPTKIPASLLRFEGRIIHRQQVVPFHHLPAVMAQVKTVIAPLEQNAFTRCKSGLKFFEAVAAGCSVVATPIPDIDRFESVLLRKCSNLDEWKYALTKSFNLTAAEKEAEAIRVCSLVDADTIAKEWVGKFLK